MLEAQALVLTELGRYPAAQQALQEAAGIHANVGEKLTYDYLIYRLKLALALLRNDGKAAISIAHRLSDVIAASHLQLYFRSWQINALLEEGQGRLLEHDPGGAIPLLQRAMQLESAILDPTSPARAQSVALLGIGYLESGDRSKALELLSQARSIAHTHPELSVRYLRPIHELAERLGGHARPEQTTWTIAPAEKESQHCPQTCP
jgi:tetratricopeptide (TPR) repeat protein